MDAGTSLALQYAVVAAAVLASAVYVLRRQAPTLVRRLRLALAAPLARSGRPAWMHALARRIAPPSLNRGGCGDCDGCD
jgi:hypothetical protein